MIRTCLATLIRTLRTVSTWLFAADPYEPSRTDVDMSDVCRFRGAGMQVGVFERLMETIMMTFIDEYNVSNSTMYITHLPVSDIPRKKQFGLFLFFFLSMSYFEVFGRSFFNSHGPHTRPQV